MPAQRPVAEELAETSAGTPAVAGAPVQGNH
jgi:hypothetical protein